MAMQMMTVQNFGTFNAVPKIFSMARFTQPRMMQFIMMPK